MVLLLVKLFSTTTGGGGLSSEIGLSAELSNVTLLGDGCGRWDSVLAEAVMPKVLSRSCTAGVIDVRIVLNLHGLQ